MREKLYQDVLNSSLPRLRANLPEIPLSNTDFFCGPEQRASRGRTYRYGAHNQAAVAASLVSWIFG